MSARRSAGNARNDATAFRADPAVSATDHPSHRQSIALITVLVLVAAAIATASYLVRPDKARSFDLLHGSVFLADQVAPVGIDLASGKPTLRLVGADKQVGASRSTDLALLGVQGGTLMIDRTTGEFNMVDDTGFVIKHDNGGVLLTRRTDKTTAAAVAPGGGAETGVPGAAYIIRSGPAGTNMLLVNQSNVEAASQGSKVVKPRASLTTPDVADTGPGAAAGADGDLWVLFGSGNDQHTIRQLSVPNGSSTGTRLSAVNRGSVTGAAAIGAATANADGTGPTALAVASPRLIRFFLPGRSNSDSRNERDITLRRPAGVDSILPVSNAQGRITFLMHAAAGWSVVSAASDGTDVRGPTSITGIPAGAQLAPPAWSNGALYTLDRSAGAGGHIYQISAGAQAISVPGAVTYPLAAHGGQVAESADVSDTYLVARGPRVLVNSPSHAEAVALFTDGARRPLIIHKSSAVDVSASGGAEALTRNNLDPSNEQGKPPKNGGKTTPTSGRQINNSVDCTRSDQKPHIPVLGTATPGSRSVALQWTYPTLDPQDCVPSTYVVSVKTLSADAPVTDGSVKVQGQNSLNLTGLYPSTQYEVTVTAFLNSNGTQSKAIRVTTGPEGPAAPTSLKVSTTSDGNWNLTWDGCGAAQSCVPVSSWRVVPSFCDGRGLSSAPAAVDASADPSSIHQPALVYRGTDALLGRGVQFQIEGTGSQGQAGTPSARSGCVYSWTPPVAADISVSASTPPPTATDSTTATTATVRFASGAVHDLGGVGGQLTYQLLSGGAVVSTVGPTSNTSVQLGGVRPGQKYQVQVAATPPRHPEAAVTIGPVAVDPTIAPWPDVQVNAAFGNDSFSTGTLSVSFDFPAGTDTRGESFDVVRDNSALVCGQTVQPLERTDVAPGQRLDFGGVDRFNYNGDCTVRLQLQQNGPRATDPPLFGAGRSGVGTAGVAIPLPSATTTASDFTAQWSGDQNNPKIVVSYHGNDPLTTKSSDWTIAATNGSSVCGTTSSAPTATIDVDTGCIKTGGNFSVSVDYTYLLATKQHFEGIPVSGTAPQPVDPSKVSFTAAWNTDAANPAVDMTYTGSEDKSKFSSLNWTESVISSGSPGVTCGSATGNPGVEDVSVPVTDFSAATGCPPTDADGQPVVYTLTVHFDDTTYDQHVDRQYQVSGTPPT